MKICAFFRKNAFSVVGSTRKRPILDTWVDLYAGGMRIFPLCGFIFLILLELCYKLRIREVEKRP